MIDTIEPSIVNETLQSLNSNKWHKAMHFEHISLIQNENGLWLPTPKLIHQ
jgi:hypothetical protein